MKKGNRIRTFVLVLLMLCAVSLTAAAQGSDPAAPMFVFPNGLTWNAAISDMCDTQAVDDPALYRLAETEIIQEYWFPNASPDDGPMGWYYIYRDNALACHGIDYFPYDPGNVAMLHDKLTEAYGEPVPVDSSEAVAMFNAYEDHFPAEILQSVEGWMPGGDTAIYLMNINNETYVYYVNEARLYGDQ